MSAEAKEFKIPRTEIISKKNIIFDSKSDYDGNKSVPNK